MQERLCTHKAGRRRWGLGWGARARRWELQQDRSGGAASAHGANGHGRMPKCEKEFSRHDGATQIWEVAPDALETEKPGPRNPGVDRQALSQEGTQPRTHKVMTHRIHHRGPAPEAARPRGIL